MPNNKLLRKSISITESTNTQVHLRNGGMQMQAVSPLQRFVRAKKRITQTFEEVTKYLKEARDFLVECEISEHLDQETRKDLSQVDGFLQQVFGITEVLSRDHMKVAFFGRTSNGKSSVINAMMKDRILPSGIGHTTNCFVSVHGCDGSEGYMIAPDSKEKKNLASLQQLAHALGDDKIECSGLIQVFWPKDRCYLLRDDVVFVDSPGIDVSPDLDSWIDKYCLDADVFVLVVNSESTLNQTEKSFFYKVNSRLSRPNVFILNNRWDASADDDPSMISKVKQQHLERTISFLADELKCVNKKEAIDRVFFVSALETLRYRMNQKRQEEKEGKKVEHRKSIMPGDDIIESATGQKARLIEFENFEVKFQECISKSAITTKFEGHASRGIGITGRVREVMEQVVGRAYSQRRWCEAQKQDLEERLQHMTNHFEFVSKEMKSKINKFAEQVEHQVAKAMSEEIRRIGHLVDYFDYPFHPHAGFLRNYKKELHSHIENGLGTNLKARCSAPLIDAIESYKNEMRDAVHSLIPADVDSCIITVTPRRDFEVSYELDVHSLCSDFQEDITFHFSLGWTNLMRKYLAPRNARLAILLGANISQKFQLPAPSSSALVEKRHIQDEAEKEQSGPVSPYRKTDLTEYPGRYDEDELTVAVIHALASLTSTTSCGILVVAGLVWRTLGWKLILCAAGGYGFMYVVERVRWTNSAKEKCFKKQFVEYATEKLQLIVSFTSKSCSHQVEQELSSTFIQLQSEVESANEKLKKEIEGLEQEMKRLEEVEAKAKIFRNKASWLESELNSFIREFSLDQSKM